MRVHAIETGTALVRQRQLVGEGRGTPRVLRTLLDRHWADPAVPLRAWLIEHPEGLILIDTGETSRVHQAGYQPRWHPYFRRALREYVRPEEELGPQLRRLGFSPDDVRWVVMTHMHTDHAGGLEHVPRAEIIVSAAELAYASGRLGLVRGYLPNRWPRWFRPRRITLPERPYGPFPESMTLTHAGDVVLVDTSGHTPGHISVVLEDDEGPRLFFAGDAAYTQDLMLQGRVDGLAPDDASALRTFRRMQQLTAERPTVFLPTHDPDVPERLAHRRTVPAV
jgi:glyoxylase-like metal-dependent hydrolase (beta-lactamase superfamily II)